MKANVYIRWSPRSDADTTEATKAQRTICRNHCRAKGYEVAAEFVDENVSGDEEDRPNLWAAVDSLKRGWVLVVADPERLARSTFLEESIYRIVTKAGARIEAVQGGVSGNSIEDELIRKILSNFREYQKKVAAARTRSRMLAHQANGRAMSKHAPIGWERSGAALVATEAEQAILARIRDLHAQGFTAGAIARQLNAEHVPCRGTRWHRETIRRALAR